MKVYMDSCCLNRPFDDLSFGHNRLEAEAVLILLDRAGNGELELVVSQAVEMELKMNADSQKRADTMEFLAMAQTHIKIDGGIYSRAGQLCDLGLRALDALHVACAERAGCVLLFTTDNAMINCASRSRERLSVRVTNPLAWLQEDITHGHN